jgi:putative hydrolase of the HAD superfamily
VSGASAHRISAVSLDAHGTLIELPSPAAPLRLMLEQRFGVRVSLEQVREAFAAEVRYYRAHMVLGRDAQSVVALRQRCAEVLREALPSSSTLASVGTVALAETLLDSLRFRTFPDVLPTLRALRAAGLRLAVASNWDASLPELLDRLGVGAELDGVATSAEVGAAKPDPAVIEAALAYMGAAPALSVHVGDVYTEDVLGARAAGVEPILLLRDGGEPPPGVRAIRSLTELRNLVCRAD